MAVHRKLGPSHTPRAPTSVAQAPVSSTSVHAAPRPLRYAPGSARGRLLPTTLRAGIESLSGMDMSGVRVHYDSSMPAQLNALAYAQGSRIHLAPGQEKHLPHEAWHVVQQMQGKVRTTTQVEGVGVNDDASLEHEADRMGERAMQLRKAPVGTRYAPTMLSGVAQLTVKKQKAGHWYSDYDPYATFPTKAEASKHEKKLKGKANAKARRNRVPTMYTYTHTKVGNRIGHTLQGPHTVAHRLILRALQSVKTLADVQSIFDDQVLTPDDVDAVMTEEAPTAGYSTQIQGRVDRATTAYRKIHTRLSAQLGDPGTDLILAKHRLNKLMNLDPYATYGWKSSAKASKKSLKGKGENVANPTFDNLLDRPSSKSIRNEDALDSFIEARTKLFDLHF